MTGADTLGHSDMAMETQPASGFDNRISLQKLEVFCLVVELGGIGRAADHLGVSQPVVTAHMRTLQERVGTKLIYRDGQRLHLTETGEAVHEWAKDVLTRGREVSRQVQGLADGATGTAVVIASMSVGSYMLPEAVSAFARERPRASIILLVSDSEDAKAALEHGGADFAVLTGDSEMSSATLVAEPVCDHELILVASPDDTEVGDVVAIEDLRGCATSARPGPGRAGASSTPRWRPSASGTAASRSSSVIPRRSSARPRRASACASCCARRSCPSWSTARCARWRSRARGSRCRS